MPAVALVSPADNARAPPEPDVPLPTVKLTLPPRPPVALPLTIDTHPLFPETDEPVDS